MSKENAIDEHFGTGKWRRARQVQGEAARKNVLLEVYEERLRALPNVHTGAFEIASKNETARYALVFATHSDAGLACFNQMKWRMDPYRGRNVSEKRGTSQFGLFDDTPELSSLRGWLNSLAGRAMTFEDLVRQAGRLGFMPTHLRTELSSLAAEGLAIREKPLDDDRSPWPDGSVVRFYPAP